MHYKISTKKTCDRFTKFYFHFNSTNFNSTRCDISSKEAELPGRYGADMGPVNSLHASTYYIEYNESFNFLIKRNLRANYSNGSYSLFKTDYLFVETQWTDKITSIFLVFLLQRRIFLFETTQ